MKIDLNLEL